jgi:hypothetical protein
LLSTERAYVPKERFQCEILSLNRNPKGSHVMSPAVIEKQVCGYGWLWNKTMTSISAYIFRVPFIVQYRFKSSLALSVI